MVNSMVQFDFFVMSGSGSQGSPFGTPVRRDVSVSKNTIQLF